MGDDLMAEEIEIHPVMAGAALRATEQIAIECAGFGKIAHGKGKMKTGPLGHA